ncbi:hypothetical protein [Cohnella faecalis]|uniref:Uncharacterized protein n=1 Tax=Cohnella faecalis TaxID=2315694 RepID=A0A398CRY4_9BACL|nr:hypothetical protein [Cohnella faecalis]RIE02557.1 hypothetical protein D3H35_17880 [Cohnella faecalis]
MLGAKTTGQLIPDTLDKMSIVMGMYDVKESEYYLTKENLTAIFDRYPKLKGKEFGNFIERTQLNEMPYAFALMLIGPNAFGGKEEAQEPLVREEPGYGHGDWNTKWFPKRTNSSRKIGCK